MTVDNCSAQSWNHTPGSQATEYTHEYAWDHEDSGLWSCSAAVELER